MVDGVCKPCVVRDSTGKRPPKHLRPVKKKIVKKVNTLSRLEGLSEVTGVCSGYSDDWRASLYVNMERYRKLVMARKYARTARLRATALKAPDKRAEHSRTLTLASKGERWIRTPRGKLKEILDAMRRRKGLPLSP